MAHAAQVNYRETGSLITDRNRLRNPNDGYMDEVHVLRDRYAADVVVLIVDYGDCAGIAYGIGVENAADAFAVVVDNYAIGNYTFAHEIGHLVGGRHDNDPETTPARYGHGYRYEPGYWRTIMAIPLYENDPTFRINYWSNPRKYLGGVPMGTADWNDMARVWNERARILANFRSPAPLSVYIDGPYEIYWSGSGIIQDCYTWTATPVGGVPPYSYSWYKNGNPTGITNSTYQECSPFDNYGSNQFTLTVEVRDSRGSVATASINVNVYYNPSIKELADGFVTLMSIPTEFSISQNYPNPFNPETEIKFALPENSRVRITIVDVLGREVIKLLEGEYTVGYHRVRWDGRDKEGRSVGSGVYFYRFTAIGESGKRFDKVMKMVLAR